LEAPDRRLTLFPKINLERNTGIVMIITTTLAVIIANSPWSDEFHHLLLDKFIIGCLPGPQLELSLEEWINDGLMVMFFFMAGLEMKREIAVGELSTGKKAALPLFAAVGGMIVPALIFVSINYNEPHLKGWGIPIATDIAYSLGILGLLAKRVPRELRTFLIALAIFDDLGAILVIAIFYSSSISFLWLGGGILAFGALMVLNRFNVKLLRFYALLGFVMWVCFLYSGIHPTIAGVLLAIAIPSKAVFESQQFLERTKERIEALSKTSIQKLDPLTEKAQGDIIERIRLETKRSNPPLIRVENQFRKFNSFFVVPMFVIANAGVTFKGRSLELITEPLTLGIILGLLVGKVLGITFFSWLAVRFKISNLPENLGFKRILGVSFIAGIGFTMSLFITHLAFDDRAAIDAAKIGILLASLVAGIIGFLFLRNQLRIRYPEKPKEIPTN
jgi:NhaA family Na+:H+ antiporter